MPKQHHDDDEDAPKRANKFGVKRLDLTEDGEAGGGIAIAYDPPSHMSEEDAEDLAESLLDALATPPKRYQPPKGPKDKDAETRAKEAERRAEAAERRAEKAEARERAAAAERADRAEELAQLEEERERVKREAPPTPGTANLVRGGGGAGGGKTEPKKE